MRLILVFLSGLVFGLGIVISGMANPAKVLNFFDIAGSWDPSLLFVMASAMITAMVGYRLVLARNRPVFDSGFHLPKAQQIDGKLVVGAALFGVGWGISGFCPGGAVPAIGLGRIEPLIFIAAMICGFLAARIYTGRAGGGSAARDDLPEAAPSRD